jgi:hypothetical protein
MATLTDRPASNGERFFGSFFRAEGASATPHVVLKARLRHDKELRSYEELRFSVI